MPDPRTLQLKLRRIRYAGEVSAIQSVPKLTHFIFKEQHETAEEATDRFRAEHAGECGYDLIVVGWLPTSNA